VVVGGNFVIKRTDEVPVLLTSFAFREEYFSELEGMVASVREYHPNWRIVTGKGPVQGFELPTLDVESPEGKHQWSLPVSLNLDGSVDDWRKITKMKAWWLARVWHSFGHLTGGFKRLLWIDADARINGPLDIELSLESEVIAGAWWRDARHPGYDTIASGLLLFQGSSHGTIEAILNQWSNTCISHIQKLPDPPLVPWGDGDQEVLNQILKVRPMSNGHYTLIRLDSDKYCAIVDKDGTPRPGALVDQWVMARKMKWPRDRDRSWPPPEEARRKLRAQGVSSK
jgi:hypothetical protein